MPFDRVIVGRCFKLKPSTELISFARTSLGMQFFYPFTLIIIFVVRLFRVIYIYYIAAGHQPKQTEARKKYVQIVFITNTFCAINKGVGRYIKVATSHLISILISTAQLIWANNYRFSCCSENGLDSQI